jgi:hypothetical protein
MSDILSQKKSNYKKFKLKDLPWVDEDFKQYLKNYFISTCGYPEAKWRYEDVLNLDVYIYEKDLGRLSREYRPYDMGAGSGHIVIYFDKDFDYNSVDNIFMQHELKASLIHEIAHLFSLEPIDYWVDVNTYGDDESQLQLLDIQPDFSSDRFVSTPNEGVYIDRTRYINSPEERQAFQKEFNYIFSLGYTPREIYNFYSGPHKSKQEYDLIREFYNEWRHKQDNIPFEAISSSKKFNWYKIAQTQNDRTLVVYDFDDTIAHGTNNLQRILNIGQDKPYIWLNDFLRDYSKYGNDLYIMTARMQKTMGDCKKKIREFLKQFGVDFPESNIICSGFLPSTAICKDREFRKILEEEDIGRIIFIDDDSSNRSAVRGLCADYPQIDFIVI